VQIPTVLLFCITLATGLVGIVFLCFPHRIRKLEAWLNVPWGGRELISFRIGLHGEQAFERIMNRSVPARQIVWDDWLLRYPRLFGSAFCLVAVWLGWHL